MGKRLDALLKEKEKEKEKAAGKTSFKLINQVEK